jgi:adenosylmethionine-8-amino-7-oxononanoate aminotransferase
MGLKIAHLDAYWMPFTANRSFKKKPRIITKASGAYWRHKGKSSKTKLIGREKG